MTEIILWIIGTLFSTTLIVAMSRKFGASLMIGVYASMIVMSQIFATKMVMFGEFVVPGAVVFYAVTYLLTDALSEFYGEEYAKKAVYTGLASCIMLVLGVQLLINWTPADFWTYQAELEIILQNTWRITAASMLAYFVSQRFDVFLYNKIKRKTEGKHLWLRNNVSTLSSQAIDTAIFIGVAFAFTMGSSELLMLMLGQYVVKVIIAFIDTPFIYILRAVFNYKK